MGTWHDRWWEPALDAPYRRDQRGGPYLAYEPGGLCTWPVALTRETSDLVARTEADVRRLSAEPQGDGLEGLARFLLRSEAIASSRIEGLVVSAQQVAIAELAVAEEISGRAFNENARLVANNVTVLHQASNALAAAPAVTVDAIDSLHKALLHDPQLHNIRTEQNWLGGSDWHPLEAAYVSPPPEFVRGLMDDLAAYATGAAHSPLVQAALVHAQFETIHPYKDGNGRVGRALIHTVLTRRGLTPSAILPISLVLLTLSRDYIEGLTTFRFDGHGADDAGQIAVDRWLKVFVDAAQIAADQARQFAEQITELHGQWVTRLSEWRSGQGMRELPRAGSATSRLLDRLAELPLFTVQTVMDVLGVSDVAARAAAEELTAAGIVSRRRLGSTSGYFAGEVFQLLNITERRIASTKWDTRESPPSRNVPQRQKEL